MSSDFEKKLSPGKKLNEDWFEQCYRRYNGHPVKILLAMYRGNYHKFFLAAVFFLIKHSPVWILPIVTASIINLVLAGGEGVPGSIIGFSILLAVLLVLNIPTNYAYMVYKSRATRYAETGLRKALVKKIQELSIGFHVGTESGRLHSKIMRDVEAIESLSSQLFLSTLNIGLNIIIALGVTIGKSRIVFLFFLITAPVAAYIMWFFRNIMKKSNREFRKEMEETSARVLEMVEMVPVTRAHSLERVEAARMSEQLLKVAEKGYRLDLVQSLFGSLGWVVFQIFQVICLAFTGFLAFKGQVQAGDIALYQSYFASIVNQVSAIMGLVPTIAKGVESVNSIGEVLLSDDIEENEGKEAVEDVEGIYDFENVHFSYGDEKEILNGLDLHVKKGETIAFVGPSGAGKTTIINMIIGFYLADSGRVCLDGRDIKDIDLRTYRKHIAVVPQSPVLFTGSIRDNIAYGCENVSDDDIMEAVRMANLSEFISSLPSGLDTRVGEHGAQLSGGQRQRVSIARAVIRKPDVLIFDEATSALDSVSEKLIQDAIYKVSEGRTTFMVAHRLSTIRNADRIAVISGGKCSEIGTYDELMALRGEFYNLKMLQS